MIFKRLVLYIIIINVIISFTTNCIAFNNDSQNDFTIEVDTFNKTIWLGENATFYWNVSVSEDVKLRRFTFSVDATNSNFSESNFELKGGQTKSITQTYHPLIINENRSLCLVTWIVREYFGNVELDRYGVEGLQSIQIINETEDKENKNDESDNSNEFNSVSLFVLIISIIIIILFFLKRKKATKKERNFIIINEK
jgi:hypothetical protein